jgi:hypothetical protein
MADFLTSLGSSMGMTGPGGIMGGLGQMLGNSITGQGQGQGGGQGAQAQAPTVQVGQAQYTNPFQPVSPTSNAQTAVQPGTNMAQQTATNWANNYILPSYGTPINTGSASGSVYR